MQSGSSEASWSGPWPEVLHRGLRESEEPGDGELRAVADGVFNGSSHRVRLTRLKRRVYRLKHTDAAPGSLICKRVEPAVAQRMRLVAERWLPALGLEGRAARLLKEAAARTGDWIWQLYEDLGDDTLASHPLPERIAAAVDGIAELHMRGAEHPILSEIRHHAGDLGIGYFTDNVDNALRLLQALQQSSLPDDARRARAQLLDRLRTLQADASERTQCLRDAGGPDTVLHGDLWTTNVFVIGTPQGLVARLIDWERIGVGPFSYDLSALLYRFQAAERRGIVGRYRQRMQQVDWPIPGDGQLNLLCDTAEQSRYANCVAWTAAAWRQSRAEWAPAQLVEIARWFAALEPTI